jgi:hypothetical protein
MVGTIANTSTSLVGLGYTELLLGEQLWAISMLLVGGSISAFTTAATRGSIPYAAGIIWALCGIVVANAGDPWRLNVALIAGAMALVVALALAYGRTRAATTAV